MSYALGKKDCTCVFGSCNVCEVIIRFFKERLPIAIDGRIGYCYLGIVDYCLDKVIIYLGHVLRCRVQQLQIKKIMLQSKGKTVVIIMDYMMKWEEY